jgi:hypothetical protein
VELPANQTVEINGTNFDTSNQWLHTRLTDLLAEDEQATRLDILTEIDERLAALSWKVSEMENAAASGRTKDEDKRKLAEILRREEFQKPQQAEESWASVMIRRLLEKLASLFPKGPSTAPSLAGMPNLAVVLQIGLLMVVIGLIAFGFYRFAPMFFPALRRKRREKKDDRVILGERIDADDSGSDLFAAAEELARTGDLRAAIRKGYIALLCDLSDRKVIGLARHKTNRDYLRDVRKQGDLYTHMRGMTEIFERHWYGLQPSEQEAWAEFRDRFYKAVRA